MVVKLEEPQNVSEMVLLEIAKMLIVVMNASVMFLMELMVASAIMVKGDGRAGVDSDSRAWVEVEGRADIQ